MEPLFFYEIKWYFVNLASAFIFYSIDATCTQGRLCQYANDAYPEPPNCVMKLKKFKNQKPRLCLFAHRDINKGEELVYDYGDDTRNLWWRKKVCFRLSWIFDIQDNSF